MKSKKYKMRIVRGAFVEPKVLDEMDAKVIEKLENDNWQSIEEVVVDLDKIKELQKNMVKHYDDPNIPWYMDGRGVEDKNDVIVAFGADDGEGGRIFQFRKNDKLMHGECVEYGISKGIPREQMDFMEVNF